MADFKFPVEDVEVSSAELSAAISSSTCNPPPKSKMILTGNPLATTFEVDPKHELYSREVESDLQYQDIPLPPPSINLSSKPGSPSSPISSLADLTPARKKSISGISLPFGRSEYPTSISQASDFLVRERKQSDTTEKYPEPFLPHQSGQSFTGGTLPSFLSNPSLITTTSTAVSAPSLSSIDEDLITRAIAWLDQDAPELTLSVTPLVPLHQASLPSASNPSATTIHPPVCSNDGFSTTLSIRYCPQSSDPTQLASPPPEYHPAQAARYPFLPNPSRLKACDQDPGPWHDSLCSTVPEACKQHKLEHTHVCSDSPKCRGKMSPKNESSYPVIISAIWAITIPLGCLVCNGPWLVVYPEKPPIGIGVLILYCYLVVIMLSSMWKAAWSDPGIIPRNLDIEPEVDWDDEHNPPQEGNVTKEAQSLSQAQIRPRLVNIGDYIVPTKWCRRCRTYRPPRASHCRICDFCVQQSDHHCTFLNNCIGRKNYFVFLAFLFTTAVTMLNTMAISIFHLALMTDRTANPAAIGNYVVIVLAFLLGVPVLGLLIFHIRLISRNVTTTERLRPIIIQEDGVESPAQRDVHIYSLDKWYSNWLWIVCRPNFDLEGTPPNPLLIR